MSLIHADIKMIHADLDTPMSARYHYTYGYSSPSLLTGSGSMLLPLPSVSCGDPTGMCCIPRTPEAVIPQPVTVRERSSDSGTIAELLAGDDNRPILSQANIIP